MRERVDGEIEFARLGAKARRDHPHHRRHKDFADQDESEQRREQHGERLLGEVAHRRLAAIAQRAGGQRHEGGAESAFGEQAAEQVGQALRDEKRIGDRPGAEDRRGQDVADEARGRGSPAYRSRPWRPNGAKPCRLGVEEKCGQGNARGSRTLPASRSAFPRIAMTLSGCDCGRRSDDAISLPTMRIGRGTWRRPGSV